MTQQRVLTLPSGLAFDYTHLMGDDAVTEAALWSLAPRLSAAHEAVCEMRKTGVVRGHLSKDGAPELVKFTELPYVKAGHLNAPDTLEKLRLFGRSLKGRVDVVASFGIGGSYLGNKVLFDAGRGEFWNNLPAGDRNGWPRYYFGGQNLDPLRAEALTQELLRQAGKWRLEEPNAGRRYRVMLIVISKSGGTLDTMATFMSTLASLYDYADLIETEVVAVTDPATGEHETLLHRLAFRWGWTLFRVPDGVGGRFSVFSDVGLVTAAALGLDFDSFLAGARSMDEVCATGDVYKNPAMLNAALKYLAAQELGCRTEVFMPYADCLKSLAEWYVQLLAESLGKRTNRAGETVHYGRTPVVAVGTTDMHAQTQQHQDGPKDKVVQFVTLRQWAKEPVVPHLFVEEPELLKMAGLKLSEAQQAAMEANAEALAADGRLNAAFVLPELSMFHLGELMYLLALSVAYEGELADVDAFDQPGVEAYKKIMWQKLDNKREK